MYSHSCDTHIDSLITQNYLITIDFAYLMQMQPPKSACTAEGSRQLPCSTCLHVLFRLHAAHLDECRLSSYI